MRWYLTMTGQAAQLTINGHKYQQQSKLLILHTVLPELVNEFVLVEILPESL